jgi:hypothetical protein
MSRNDMIPYAGMDWSQDSAQELAEVIDDCPNCAELEAARNEMHDELKCAVQEILFLKRKLDSEEELANIAREIYREQLFASYKVGSKEKMFDLKLHDALGRYNEAIGISDGSDQG